MTTGDEHAERRARHRADKRAVAVTQAPHSAWFYLRLGLSIGLVVIVLGLASLLVVIPRVTDAVPLTVLTQSMEPTLPPGTLIVVRPVDPADVAIGDVVTYQIEPGDPALITHRVIGVQFSGDGVRQFTLKGDNNDVADAELVSEAQIRGRLWYSVPGFGYVSNFMNGDARGLLIPIVAVLLLAFAAWSIISALVARAPSQRVGRAASAAEAGVAPFHSFDEE